MDFMSEPLDYRHKKFDLKRQSYEETVIMKRARSNSIGTESTCSEVSYGTATKRRRLISDSSMGTYSTVSGVSTEVNAKFLPKISEEKLANICKYHGNMVRQFPKKERTPKDQERRNKNTLACRRSRYEKKLNHIVIAEEYKAFHHEYLQVTNETVRTSLYLKHLEQLITKCLNESIAKSNPAPKKPNIKKKSFTIEYLLAEC